MDGLIKFEQHVLSSMDYLIQPLSSPVSFMRHLLNIGNVSLHHELLLFTEANSIIEDYWESKCKYFENNLYFYYLLKTILFRQ